jgi:hypothetical protein
MIGGRRGAGEPGQKLPILGVLRTVWEVYKRRWPVLVGLSLIVLLPQAIADAAFGDVTVDEIRNAGDVLKLATIPFTVGINLGGEALYAGLIAAGVQQWMRGRELRDIPGVIREIRLGRLIAIDLILVAGTILGLALLVIPGIVFYTYFAASPALVELDDLKIGTAMRRSFEIVRGNFTRVLAFIGLVVLVSDGAMLILEAPLHGLTGEAVWNLVLEAVFEPVQGLTTVFLALALLDIRGEDRRLEAFAARLRATPAERDWAARARTTAD